MSTTEPGRRRMPPPPDPVPLPTGAFTELDGETVYQISGLDHTPPFLMSLTSDTDLWMYVTSSGGLTAGRVDPDGAIFPYETQDRLLDGHHHTGPVTVLRVRRPGERDLVWEPFSERDGERFRLERLLSKTPLGNRITFEEVNSDLGLSLRYRWTGCDAFGFVRTVTVTNLGPHAVELDLLDGLRNILPPGAPLSLYQQSSSLVDAYKRSEYDSGLGLAIYSLTSKIVDRAEAAESLRAGVAWCRGLDAIEVSLSADAVASHRRGEPIPGEPVRTGRRGSFLVRSALTLAGGASHTWHVVIDTARSHGQIAALSRRIRADVDISHTIERALTDSNSNLHHIVAAADGFQLTGNVTTTAHHAANVMFNVMRGGAFAKNHDIETRDLIAFMRTRNRPVADRQQPLLSLLPSMLSITKVTAAARATGDSDFVRLCLEYLPLYFGRRHGDPSRPWNRFAIRVRNDDGGRALQYEGNWRDIFQNWEALARSFPDFLPGMVAKFVNASTVDGFNPYRITRDGIDWEVEDPSDAWSYIGYWGDHQIIYLLKLLEMLRDVSPHTLVTMMGESIFSYANVPYRIAPYDEIVANPHETIQYDEDLAEIIDARVDAMGTDGRLVLRGGEPAADVGVHHVGLFEKLLVPTLSKLSNWVPGAGIWMNTQRPEWNDANNALAGNGVSMVTSYYLRRHLTFLSDVWSEVEDRTYPVSLPVADWFREVAEILRRAPDDTSDPDVAARDRKMLTDRLGRAFSHYRERAYGDPIESTVEVSLGDAIGLCRSALRHLDHAIAASRRDDGLYHAYNLLEMRRDRAIVRPLYQMLEGQVAALSSGAVGAEEALRLLEAMYKSPLYRGDQDSFLLHPARDLPAFMDRNVVPDSCTDVPLLGELLAEGNTAIIERDAEGRLRFHADFTNARDVAATLDELARDPRWSTPVMRDRRAVLDVYEDVFNHHAFTGRSGAIYGYEGLGCIYWHMVAKLLLAVQEIVARAERDGEPRELQDALRGMYHRVRDGLGFNKTVAEYGAFPTDPYSHTPPHATAQQPGMTGQVKEEILTRFGELGVTIAGGIVAFRPTLLLPEERLREPETFRYVDIEGRARDILLPAGALAFTYCQVPVVYAFDHTPAHIRVTRSDGDVLSFEGNCLDTEQSRALLGRRGEIARIDVLTRTHPARATQTREVE